MLHVDIGDQQDIHKILEARENLKMCLTWFSDDSIIAPAFVAGNKCFGAIIQLAL
jgi:hypothetical protein